MEEITLDETDKKILFNLDFHSRMPLSLLSKKAGKSMQVLKYHLEKLQKEKVIEGFYADINASKIGYNIYLVYLKFGNMPEEKSKQFIKHLSEHESVGVNVGINGEFDHCTGIWAESVLSFEAKYRDIMKSYAKYVRKRVIMIETRFHYFKPKLFSKEKPEDEIVMEGEPKILKLDKTDKKILEILSSDARKSLLDISEATELTPNAVKNRIKILEKEKIILGYRVMINYPILGYLHYRVFLQMENLTEEKEKELTRLLKNLDPVISVTKTIGFCDLEFRCIIKDVDEFYNLMSEIRKNFPEIISYDSIIYHKFYEALNYYPFKE